MTNNDKPVRNFGRLCWYLYVSSSEWGKTGKLVELVIHPERRRFKHLFWGFWWEVDYE